MTDTSKTFVGHGPIHLTQPEFTQMAKLVYAACGINLVQSKKVMLESRLGKRLRALNLTSFKSYIEYLTSTAGMDAELIHMIDVVTTNKTDFFREPHHFDFLAETLLPKFHQQNTSHRPFKIWSSACSSGEEPYTMAMVLQDFAFQHSSFSFNVTASDISTQVLQKATTAIYAESQAATIPLVTKKRYFLKSKDQERPTVRLVPEIRNKVNFVRLNLTENSYKIIEEQDAIFCRNVLIYFDRKTQVEVVRKLMRQLKPGGHLFIGHSESLHQFDLGLQQIKPTIFIKP